MGTAAPPTGAPRPGGWPVGLVLLKVGLLAFGGPAAHVALMRRELVERRRWLEQERFFQMFAACNLIPGPSSTELATFVGYRLAGWRGLVLGGALFIAPAMAIMLAVAWAYVRLSGTWALHAVLYGVRPVVVGVVAWALLDLARRALRRPVLVVVALAAAVLALAGISGVALLAAGGSATAALLLARRLRGTGSVAWLGTLDWHAWLGAPELGRLPVLFLTFLKIGATAFGSGYVLFALLKDDFVDGLGWLDTARLADAVAIGQVTPGPVFTTATFLGYLFAGVPGALLATVAIFLPGFALVPFLDRIVSAVQSRPAADAFLAGVNAAVIGLIAAVAVQLAQVSIVDPWTAAIAAASFPVLLWRPLAAPALVVLGAGAGLLTFRLLLK